MNYDGVFGGTAEVAAYLDCPRQQIHSLRRLKHFPQPVFTLRATPVWDMGEVSVFKTTWKRHPKKSSESG